MRFLECCVRLMGDKIPAINPEPRLMEVTVPGESSDYDMGRKVGGVYLWFTRSCKNLFRSHFIHDKLAILKREKRQEYLGHGVGNLLEKDRAESRVETSDDTFFSKDAGKARKQSSGKRWLRHESDTCRLEWAESNIGKEFGDT